MKNSLRSGKLCLRWQRWKKRTNRVALAETTVLDGFNRLILLLLTLKLQKSQVMLPKLLLIHLT